MFESQLYRWLMTMNEGNKGFFDDMKKAMQDDDLALEIYEDFRYSVYNEELDLTRTVISRVLDKLNDKGEQ